MPTHPWQLNSYSWLRNRIRAANNPNLFHGWGKRRNYFEGWYFKLVVPQQDIAYAFIPGLSLQADGSGHAFIQVLDGIRGRVAYHRFALNDFQAARDSLSLQLGNNFFSEKQLSIELPDIKANIDFQQPFRWPKRLLAPGVMGWYGWVPGMECYHGMVSAHHRLQGYLQDDRGRKSVSGGVGYTEKDWGSSFPAAWVWMQSNHLGLKEPASLMASVAHIPWRGRHFRGFLCTWLWQGKLETFTTWNRAQHQLEFGEGFVDLYFRRSSPRWSSSKDQQLHIRAFPAPGGQLISPTSAGMTGKINESLQAELQVSYQLAGKTVYQGTARWAGLEVSERAQELLG